jgi:Flp pilus assembly protein CpaB
MTMHERPAMRWRDRLPEPVRRAMRAAAWHRRLVAGALTAIAVASALSALAPAPPRVIAVLTAASDLPAGVTLTNADLRTVELPARVLPQGVLRGSETVVGRVLAAPMRRGEPLTDVRLVGAALVGSLGGAGEVATPVRIADPAVARLLQPGDVVDVLAASTRPGGSAAAAVVAAGVRVLAVPNPSSAGAGMDDGALVVLATAPTTAAVLARAAVTARLSVTIGGAP